MCELFAMNSRYPTDVNFSLGEFALHGGGTADHRDGWGIAYALDNEFRIIKEARAAVDSDCVRYIEAHHFKSSLAVSHIRKASPPKILSFENTHPFDREFMGRRLVFAHNGNLKALDSLSWIEPGPYSPMGSTDSEAIFTHILNLIYQRLTSSEHYAAEKHAAEKNGPEIYNIRLIIDILTEVSPSIRECGTFNFLLSDGKYLIAHGDTSLHFLCRSCHLEENILKSDDLKVLVNHGPEQQVALVATVPLTENEEWEKFSPGEIRLFHQGSRI